MQHTSRQHLQHWLFILLLGVVLSGCSQAAEPTPTLPAAPEEEPTEAIAATPTEVAVEEATATTAATAAEPATAAMTATPAGTPTMAAIEAPEATTTTEAMGATDAVGLELVAEGFTSPVALIAEPGESGRLFVVDQIGVISIITAEGELLADPFLDVRDRMVTLRPDFDERGLLGMAFHPDYNENGRFFVYYSAPLRAEAPPDFDHTSHIAEFTVSPDNAEVADPESERIILQVDQPQPNHNAGQITFGPDGFLYIPLGDGGGADDNQAGHVEDWYEVNQGGNGQDVQENLLGSILRLDVNNEGTVEQPYGIPADNPFANGEGGLPEIFAYGFRNPFRIAFDRGADHDLFVSDAGQDLWEEVSIVTLGGNYGWNVKEGTYCFNTADPGQSLEECPDSDAEGEPLIDPIIEYQNANAPGGLGLVVIGGFVYRGSAMPQFEGQYFFGDWSTSFSQGDGALFVAAPPAGGDGLWSMQELAVVSNESGRLDAFLLSFGQDAAGEIYVLTTDTPGPTGKTGRIFRLVSATATP